MAHDNLVLREFSEKIFGRFDPYTLCQKLERLNSNEMSVILLKKKFNLGYLESNLEIILKNYIHFKNGIGKRLEELVNERKRLEEELERLENGDIEIKLSLKDIYLDSDFFTGTITDYDIFALVLSLVNVITGGSKLGLFLTSLVFFMYRFSKVRERRVVARREKLLDMKSDIREKIWEISEEIDSLFKNRDEMRYYKFLENFVERGMKIYETRDLDKIMEARDVAESCLMRWQAREHLWNEDIRYFIIEFGGEIFGYVRARMFKGYVRVPVSKKEFEEKEVKMALIETIEVPRKLFELYKPFLPIIAYYISAYLIANYGVEYVITNDSRGRFVKDLMKRKELRYKYEKERESRRCHLVLSGIRELFSSLNSS